MNKRRKLIAVSMAAVMIAAAFVLILPSDNSEAAAGTEADPILVLPGQTWQYTPTFPTGLTPTLTVSANAASQPGPGATYAATSGYAKVVSGSVEVTIPAGAAEGKYYVTIKAVTTQPTQTAYQNVVFQIQSKLTGTGGTVYAAVGGVQDPFSVSAAKASTYSMVSYGTLTGGASKVSVNPTTGAITVSGLVAGDVGTHTLTVKAIANDNPTNEVIITVTLVVAPQMAFTSSPSAGFIQMG